MTDKIPGFVLAGATSVTLTCLLRSAADSTEVTGKLAADMTLEYWRALAAATVSVTASDLANLNSAFVSGGVKEIKKGAYRIDWPDAAFAAGADFVHLF